MTAEFADRVRIDFIRVRMRDGVELCAKITRPDSSSSFPAVMEYNPYRRLRKPLPDYRLEYPPVVPYLAERGYAVVQFDARGTGNSGGATTDIYNDAERRDGVEMVEWVARQPWCSGNVGMIGKSFSAVVQWQVTVQRPPALKAIIVRSANDDVYTEWVYPGGCLRPYMFDSYSANMNTWNFAPPDPDVVGDDWETLWRERLAENAPWGIGYLKNPLQNDYWRERSLSADYSRVQCAAFVIGGWSDCYPTALLRAYENLTCPKKALVGPWGHWYGEESMAVPGPRIDTRPLYRRWFDHWLKGIDNGVMDEPPVTLFVRRYSPPAARMPLEERGEWRSENEWPIARREERSLYFGSGSLDEAALQPDSRDSLPYRAGAGGASGIHWGGGVLPWGAPTDQRVGFADCQVYLSTPLEDALEVTGTPRAKLFISSTAPVAYLRVKLLDVAPDGAAKLVRYGGLNATHRDSHKTTKPLEPGVVYELDVPLKAVSYTFEPGHRLGVAIAAADFQNAWPVAAPGEHSIHRGGSTASRIVLPVAPPQTPALPTPELESLPPADPALLLEPTEYSISRDHSKATTTARLEVESGDANNRLVLKSAFTVSDTAPADAVLHAEGRYRVRRDEFDIEVVSTEQTRSDADSFFHSVHIQITRDGEPYFEKEWNASQPRRMN
ncbi:MAG: CocE/NonD family hydrolase [Pirellulaceae bacterium]|jgi:hypothetical protein|nr:CocE/NonD family hydrolase [Pirellulaceae bacterium]MDP7014169.1 CocE/NonD family hydrolase [Pirellulaceae bacterium]